MGLFDWDVVGPMEDMFDLNRDGKLDIAEQSYMFQVLDEDEKEIMGSNNSYDSEDID